MCDCDGLRWEESGGLGTVWKSLWASSGSSRSHGKQHRATKNNRDGAHNIVMFRWDVAGQAVIIIEAEGARGHVATQRGQQRSCCKGEFRER